LHSKENGNEPSSKLAFFPLWLCEKDRLAIFLLCRKSGDAWRDLPSRDAWSSSLTILVEFCAEVVIDSASTIIADPDARHLL
jgi:hypothetical protein